MDKDYEVAFNYTLKARQRGREYPPPLLRARDRKKIALFCNPSGFQFVGACAHPEIIGRVGLPNYNSPAAMLGRLVESRRGIELVRDAMVGWVSLPRRSTKERRLFLEQFFASDAKRAQAMAFGPDNELWLTQNTDTDTITRIAPDETARRGWRMLDPIRLQGRIPGKIEGFTLMGERIYVLFNPRDPDKERAARLRAYTFDGTPVRHRFRWPRSNWLYGPAPYRGKLYFITAAECTDIEPGIYCGDELVVPDVTGSGLCFPYGPDDQASLVVEYGEGKGPWGAPCAFVHVPGSAFAR